MSLSLSLSFVFLSLSHYHYLFDLFKSMYFEKAYAYHTCPHIV